MSTFRTPVGPQPPKVYWRRRLILGLGALAVIVIIILIVVRPGAGSPSPSNSAKPGASPSGTPSAAASAPAAGAPCVPAKVKLVAVTDKTTYASTEQPQISMSITNTGSVACTINLGSTQQELIITSGSETIWDSKDCQTAPVDTPVTLKPGEVVPTPPIAWDRTRSSKTTCDASRPPVTAGGASYHLGVKVGALSSKSTVQFLLN
ncbi:hypothetical protein F1C58_14645 [Glaciihabitans sp. INWT7]|uniref:hypothetical protein n=1 Tax=Glaciihabitans sp. INWT7 TaxID=2596912 RepID=UPI0016286E0C|nr:hypothetical protein [Glaciihabitans sp. INWT7]QNE48014.1 hypothetical protein F1C58_14645 [Glaciihabitans sp. INWT7]